MAQVRRLLQQPGIDVNAPGQDGTPALHWVVRVNDVELAALLIRAGADPDEPTGMACCRSLLPPRTQTPR